VEAVARDLGVGWATIMRAADHGTRWWRTDRLGGVAALGLDGTSFLKPTRLVPTQWVTGLVDLEGGRLLDVVADRDRTGARGGRLAWWPAGYLAGPHWHCGVWSLAWVCQRPGRPSWSRQGGRGPLPRRPAGQLGA
jgi:hypothetical protein